MSKKIVVIGGGAAGFFGAITCARTHPGHSIILIEKMRQVLAKVRISGGGRCNVTHSCFDPAQLVSAYPRGGKALLGPFHRFQPRDTIQWFKECDVELKTEADGRMFPISNRSETIIQCLMQEAEKAGVVLMRETEVLGIEPGFTVQLKDQESLHADALLLATGSSKKGYEWAQHLGHRIIPPVPSLFTFNIKDERLEDLSGVSVPHVKLQIEGTDLKQEGPLLITHWGMSGPAILKLSAWGARILHDLNYEATLRVNWAPEHKPDQVRADLQEMRTSRGKKTVWTEILYGLPKNLWKKLIAAAGIKEERLFAQLSNQELQGLAAQLTDGRFAISGKSTNKDEFVTCGGIALNEVNFQTMESKICPGLYFAGEILDIEGITGGFNFQNAWTTAWIAGTSMLGTSLP
ncbi:MAG TPA: NAD(P)/FAD-dependent oxidoreductase [Rhabdochlamydiaceae bacterium]